MYAELRVCIRAELRVPWVDTEAGTQTALSSLVTQRQHKLRIKHGFIDIKTILTEQFIYTHDTHPRRWHPVATRIHRIQQERTHGKHPEKRTWEQWGGTVVRSHAHRPPRNTRASAGTDRTPTTERRSPPAERLRRDTTVHAASTRTGEPSWHGATRRSQAAANTRQGGKPSASRKAFPWSGNATTSTRLHRFW